METVQIDVFTFDELSEEAKEKARESSLWWQDRGLSFTATGYGSRIPTRYMVKFNGRWRRVYCRQYSNIGTLYIGKLSPLDENITVSVEA